LAQELHIYKGVRESKQSKLKREAQMSEEQQAAWQEWIEQVAKGLYAEFVRAEANLLGY